VSALAARLHALSPLAVLERGYALVLTPEGALVRSAAQIAPGNTITARLSDGAFTSRIETVTSSAPARIRRGKRSQS
jgi:exodeoxyribonuclease VII large subunit